KPEGHRRQVFGEAYGFGEQSVDTGHFVERGSEKGIEDEVDALNEGAFDAGDHRIEIVERAERDLRGRTRLWGARIDVVELLEACRIFQLTELREAVMPDALCLFRRRRTYPVRYGQPLPGKHDEGRGKQGPAIHLKLHGGRNTGGQSVAMLGAFRARRQWRMCRVAP